MHPSRLRLGPSQSRPLTDASPGSARSPGLRVCRAAPSRHRNIHTHAPFRTECQSFLRCRDARLTISRKQRSGHAAALRRQRPQVRILSGAPLQNKKENRTADAFVDMIAALPGDSACRLISSESDRDESALPARSPRRAERQRGATCATKRRRRSQIRSGRRTGGRNAGYVGIETKSSNPSFSAAAIAASRPSRRQPPVPP